MSNWSDLLRSKAVVVLDSPAPVFIAAEVPTHRHLESGPIVEEIASDLPTEEEFGSMPDWQPGECVRLVEFYLVDVFGEIKRIPKESMDKLIAYNRNLSSSVKPIAKTYAAKKKLFDQEDPERS